MVAAGGPPALIQMPAMCLLLTICNKWLRVSVCVISPQTGLDRQAIQETETEKIPVHKLGNAQQFAQLALWLMSEDAGYITGQTISVDGGMVKGIFG